MVSTKRFEWSKIKSELRNLHRQYTSASEGYRASIYDLLQKAAYRAQKLRKDRGLAVEMTRDSKGKSDAVGVVCSFLVGGKATSLQKKASKYTIALRYLLITKKIKPGKIAKTLKSEGGIQKVARKAARPRSNKPSGASCGFKNSASTIEKTTDGLPEEGLSRDDWSAVILEGPVRFLETIASASIDRRIKMTVKRSGKGNSLKLAVQKVVVVNDKEKKSTKPLVQSDW